MCMYCKAASRAIPCCYTNVKEILQSNVEHAQLFTQTHAYTRTADNRGPLGTFTVAVLSIPVLQLPALS